MIGWLQLTNEQRKATLDTASQASGINPKVIEKDWWVTLTLKALFQSTYAQHMAFKGGTSLSKCYKLIARFSEDIDIALDPAAFKMECHPNPSKGHVQRLKKQGCEFTSNELLHDLEQQLAALGLPAGTATIFASPVPEGMPDTDPQTIFVQYLSLYEPNAYIADEVKIEVSVRSLRFPVEQKPILSLLSEFAPNPRAYPETPFDVTVIHPRKTFLEKAFLLHEEFGKPDRTRVRSNRMSRHLYDQFLLMDTTYGEEALNDPELYTALIQHRRDYSRISWVDYNTLTHSLIDFIPSNDVLKLYQSDYATMQQEMIYETSVSFEELISKLKVLRGRFRLMTSGYRLSTLIAQARNSLSYDTSDNGQDLLATTEDGKQYLLTFVRDREDWSFEKITPADH